MSPESRSQSVFVARCLAVSTLAFSAGQAAAGPKTRALTAWDTGAVQRARSGAMRKLARTECQRLLVEFRDAKGRTLAENLEEWGLGPAAYVELVPFLDGARQPLCRKTETAFVSSPGVRRVYVCPAFAAFELRQPGVAESLLIHEILHTLGLGEDPPTPLEITQRVEARCR
jgi:hypothetical protein